MKYSCKQNNATIIVTKDKDKTSQV